MAGALYCMIRSLLRKGGYIWAITEGRVVRKQFAVLDKITQQLIFYDIICIVECKSVNIIRVTHNSKWLERGHAAKDKNKVKSC